MVAIIPDRVKNWQKENSSELWFAFFVFSVALASFGLGRLSAIWPHHDPITFEGPIEPIVGSTIPATGGGVTAPQSNSGVSKSRTPPASSGAFVASKNGSTFSRPDCPTAKKIKPENQLWFQTREQAITAGFHAAANCPGL